MSDTTPRPAEDPTDPTASPADEPLVADTTEQPPVPPAPQPARAEQPPAPAYAVPPQQPYPQVPPPAYAQQPPAYVPPQQPPLNPNEERTWGMLSHVVGGAAMVLSGGFLGFVGSLVIYLMYKDRGPFVRAHAANSLNVQITAAIGFLVGWLLTITIIGAIIGIPILIAVFIWAVVVHIIGAVKANNGEWWTPPMTPSFIK
ncbi:DUF4870 domain-containing protein [Oryzobacter terrae]|uniref:DUF4870 domain-containing protein n=1 Tax=Oryzobacter terrae TaxID=1620385 RepID=UPI0036733FDD